MSALKLIVLVVVCLALCEARKKKDSLKEHHKADLHKHMKGKGDVDKLIEKAEPEFEKHKSKHGNKWHPEEEDHRFVNFAKNHHSIEEHNNDHEKHGFKLATNHLSHLHENETHSMLGHKHVKNRPAPTPVHSKRAAAPSSIDWRTTGAVTPVKDQGICGSCWTFSATGALEAALFRKTGKLTSLSEENLVSCATSSYYSDGCAGGVTMYAFDYVKDNGGVQTEAAYPYIEQNTPETSSASACRLPTKTHVAQTGTSTGNSVVLDGTEAGLLQAVGTVGPVSVTIFVPSDASFFQYSSGIYNSAPCTGNPQANHAVLVVGYGTAGGKAFWIVKNSWAATWGESGYVRIARNAGNMCSIATEAAYPLFVSINNATLSAPVPTSAPSGGGSGGGIVNPQG